MSQPGGRPLAPTGRFRVRGAPRPCREGNSASSVRKGDDLSRGCEIRRAHVCSGSNFPAIRLKSGKTVGSPAAAKRPGLGPESWRDDEGLGFARQQGCSQPLESEGTRDSPLPRFGRELRGLIAARRPRRPLSARPRSRTPWRSLMNSCDRQPGVAVTWLSRAPHAGPASTPAAGAAIKCCLLPGDRTGGLRLSCGGRASATPQPADREQRDGAGR